MSLFKITCFIPESHLTEVKQAMFSQGAGKIGDYDCCSWQVLGEGQFRPLAGSNPFLGEQDKIETVAEYRVEMVCEKQFVKQAVAAMIAAHPYEEPAYDILQVIDLKSFN